MVEMQAVMIRDDQIQASEVMTTTEAAASSAPVPGLPDQLHSDRRMAGSTGCAVQCRLTGAVRTRAIAHSTCWHTASGVEWTYTTPHVGTVTSRRPRCVFPYDLDRG